MGTFQVNSIGRVRANEEGFFIELEPRYIPALQALEGFSHLQVLWWFSDCDRPQMREILQAPQPYKKAPAVMGIFATRAPVRPNPLALTAVEVLEIDHEAGRIRIAWTDAHDGSPVLDLKPYTPSLDRVDAPSVPAWCAHWPRSVEASGEFDWQNEFCF